jgi:hypothetical protein
MASSNDQEIHSNNLGFPPTGPRQSPGTLLAGYKLNPVRHKRFFSNAAAATVLLRPMAPFCRFLARPDRSTLLISGQLLERSKHFSRIIGIN